MILELKKHIDKNKSGLDFYLEYLKQNQTEFSQVKLYGKDLLILNSKPADIDSVINAGKSLIETVHDTTGIPYPLASSNFKKTSTKFEIKNICIGGNNLNMIAGPCAVETEEQIFGIAEELSKLGVKFLRGGCFKPRTSPYSFQGLEINGLKLLSEAASAFGMRVVTEVMDTNMLEVVYPYADVLQVGSRSMQNFQLLKAVGKTTKPVLLKRGMNSRIDEWLLAAEYILLEGNEKVILCERGIRTFETSMRNTMDIAAIADLKLKTHLPVFADPSHAAGNTDLILPLSKASIAAGADGLMIEVHTRPNAALSDGMQSLTIDSFAELLNSISKIALMMEKQPDFLENQSNSLKKQEPCVE